MEKSALTVSRRANETLLIGDSVEVLVVSFHGSNKVRLRVTAPRDCKILRGELNREPVLPGVPETMEDYWLNVSHDLLDPEADGVEKALLFARHLQMAYERGVEDARAGR